VAEEERREAAEKEEKEEDPERTFTTKGLSEGLSLPSKRLTHFDEMDPNIEPFAGIEWMAHDAFCPYNEIYEEKKKLPIHTKLTVFIVKNNSGYPKRFTG